MLSIVYVSTAVVTLSEGELAELLVTSRRNNAEVGVTGILLVKDAQFMQALEGPEAAVRALIQTISEDPRHTDLWTLAEEPTDTRLFPEWTMGYQGLTDESIRTIPGYDTFFDDDHVAERAWATRSRALWLLNWFRTNQM